MLERCVLAVVMLLSMSSVHANTWVYGKVVTLEDYGSYGNGYYQVLVTLKEERWPGSNESNASQVCTGRFRVVVGEQGITENEKDRIFSMLLSAYMADKSVGLYVNYDAGSYCAVQIAKIGDNF